MTGTQAGLGELPDKRAAMKWLWSLEEKDRSPPEGRGKALEAELDFDREEGGEHFPLKRGSLCD